MVHPRLGGRKFVRVKATVFFPFEKPPGIVIFLSLLSFPPRIWLWRRCQRSAKMADVFCLLRVICLPFTA